MQHYYLTPTQQQTTSPRKERVVGHYLYEWRDGHRIIYVGVGVGRRAWKPHNPPANQARLTATSFRVIILRDRLNKTIAHMLERHLIKQRLAQQQPLTNERLPPRKKGTRQ